MNGLIGVGQQKNLLIVKGLKLATNCPIQKSVYLCSITINPCVPIP